MNKVKIVLLCVAAGLVLVGGTLVTLTLWRGGGDAGTRRRVEQTYELENNFQSVVITCDDCDLWLGTSGAERSCVFYHGDSRQTPLVEVRDGVLYVDNSTVNRELGLFQRLSLLSFGGDRMFIYLPDTAYESLKIEHTSGDTTLAGGLCFGVAELRSVSGETELTGTVEGALTVHTTSGSATLRHLRCGSLAVESTSGTLRLTDAAVAGALDVDHTSGSTTMENVDCGSLRIESQSGSIRLKDVVAEGDFRVDSTSGSVTLDACDGAALDLKTTSGAVRGTLRTAKVFLTSTTSGNIHVPDTTSGGVCRVQCTSGSIDLKLAD